MYYKILYGFIFLWTVSSFFAAHGMKLSNNLDPITAIKSDPALLNSLKQACLAAISLHKKIISELEKDASLTQNQKSYLELVKIQNKLLHDEVSKGENAEVSKLYFLYQGLISRESRELFQSLTLEQKSKIKPEIETELKQNSPLEQDFKNRLKGVQEKEALTDKLTTLKELLSNLKAKLTILQKSLVLLKAKLSS